VNNMLTRKLEIGGNEIVLRRAQNYTDLTYEIYFENLGEVESTCGNRYGLNSVKRGFICTYLDDRKNPKAWFVTNICKGKLYYLDPQHDKEFYVYRIVDRNGKLPKETTHHTGILGIPDGYVMDIGGYYSQTVQQHKDAYDAAVEKYEKLVALSKQYE
jgi:hypothetical protein